MSADGSVAVGVYDDTQPGVDRFRWTAAGGVELIGVEGIFTDIFVSRDGRTIVSTVPDSPGKKHAAIWQGGRNWRTLAPFPGAVASSGPDPVVSVALGLSGDGSVIVGYAYVSTTKAVAFRWDAMNGMVNLGTFDEGSNSDSEAYYVSADGRTIIGWDYKEGFNPPGPSGGAINGRRGAVWWDGKERLLHAYGWAGEAWATNDVGSVIVGQFHPADAGNDPREGHGASTYLWTAWDGRFEDLGAVAVRFPVPQSEYISQPFAVSDDGSVVGGETGRQEKYAMIWTRETGMMYVSDFLTLKGVTEHQKWKWLAKTVYISPDGRVVAGDGFNENAQRLTWMVTLR
jgi:probable HAF family extracellular repeat protein